LLKISARFIFLKSCAVNNKLHSFALDLLVIYSSVCEKVLRPKKHEIGGSGEDGLVATMIVAALDDGS